MDPKTGAIPPTTTKHVFRAQSPFPRPNGYPTTHQLNFHGQMVFTLHFPRPNVFFTFSWFSHFSFHGQMCVFTFSRFSRSVSTAKCAFSRFHGFTFHFSQNTKYYTLRFLAILPFPTPIEENKTTTCLKFVEFCKNFSFSVNLVVSPSIGFFGLSATLKQQFRFKTFGKHVAYVCIYVCTYLYGYCLYIYTIYSFNLNIFINLYHVDLSILCIVCVHFQRPMFHPWSLRDVAIHGREAQFFFTDLQAVVVISHFKQYPFLSTSH